MVCIIIYIINLGSPRGLSSGVVLERSHWNLLAIIDQAFFLIDRKFTRSCEVKDSQDKEKNTNLSARPGYWTQLQHFIVVLLLLVLSALTDVTLIPFLWATRSPFSFSCLTEPISKLRIIFLWTKDSSKLTMTKMVSHS